MIVVDAVTGINELKSVQELDTISLTFQHF